MEEDKYFWLTKEKEMIENRHGSFFDVSQMDWLKYVDQAIEQVGRYPFGARHLENYENFSVVYPGSTLEDYH